MIKNSQPFGKKFQKTVGGIFLTHTVHFGFSVWYFWTVTCWCLCRDWLYTNTCKCRVAMVWWWNPIVDALLLGFCRHSLLPTVGWLNEHHQLLSRVEVNGDDGCRWRQPVYIGGQTHRPISCIRRSEHLHSLCHDDTVNICHHMYTVSRKKLGHFYFYCNFGKCWWIF